MCKTVALRSFYQVLLSAYTQRVEGEDNQLFYCYGGETHQYAPDAPGEDDAGDSCMWRNSQQPRRALATGVVSLSGWRVCCLTALPLHRFSGLCCYRYHDILRAGSAADQWDNQLTLFLLGFAARATFFTEVGRIAFQVLKGGLEKLHPLCLGVFLSMGGRGISFS